MDILTRCEMPVWFQILICATALLSLYSFGLYCVPNIQPPY